MYSVHGVSVAGGTFPAMIWHDFMSVALEDCEYFPEPEDPVEWIDFNGEYTSSYGGSCSSASVSGTGSDEGAYGCGSDSYSDDYGGSYDDTSSEDTDDGAYAPGKGQEPAPRPEPAPKPAPAPAPQPAPAPPSGGVTP